MGRFEVEPRYLGPAPALLVQAAGGRRPLPTVLWFHGFTVDALNELPKLERLAAAGLLAVGIDAAGHGRRRLADFEQHFAGPREVTDQRFFALVAQTVGEVPAILDALCAEGLADPTRLAVAGVSMGGLVTYGAVVADRRLRAAVALLGSPVWPLPGSPHLVPERFFPTALLSITAGNDESVPPVGARRFHEALEPRYVDAPERLRYLELAGEPHLMSAAAWDHCMDETVAWLVGHVVAEDNVWAS